MRFLLLHQTPYLFFPFSLFSCPLSRVPEMTIKALNQQIEGYEKSSRQTTQPGGGHQRLEGEALEREGLEREALETEALEGEDPGPTPTPTQ